jgi:hypothetical protein
MQKKWLKKMGKCDFKASNGWLGTFRKWRQIVFKEVCGDCGDVSEKTVANWVSKFPSIMDG